MVKESIIVIIKTVLLLAYFIYVEVYATGVWKFVLVLGGITGVLLYTWFTTHPVGSGDDDPSGNDNVNRKFTDYM